MRVLLLVASLVVGCASPAWADSRAAAAAAHAQAVHESACAGAASGRIQTTTGSLRQAAEAWDLVRAAYDGTGEGYLLYWRGLLGLCVGQEELAVADLQDFVKAQASDSRLAGLVDDARRRLARLGVKEARGPSTPPAIPIGVALGGGALGAGIGGVAAFVAVEQARAEVLGRADWDRASLDARLADGDRDFGIGIGLAVGSGVLGAAATAFLLSQAPRPQATPRGTRTTIVPTPSLHAGPDGFAAGARLWGRW